MDIQTIISEADARIPNAFTPGQKVTWLNEINNEFFDVVKIPKSAPITTVANSGTYVLPNDVRAKNIQKVIVGKSLYPSFLNEDVAPGLNYHLFDDTGATLTLNPAPSAAAIPGIVKYNRVAITTFLVGTLTAIPDAPAEYHWIYILGLCERIAKTMQDTILANNYANDYQKNLIIAQQNFARTAG